VSEESQWLALASHVQELARDSRFATLALRKANEPALEEFLAQWTVKQDAYELMHALQRIGVPAGVVQTAEDLLERDPQLRARQFLVDAAHPILGVFGHQAPPYKLSRTPAVVQRAPLLGEHTREVYMNDLGMSEDEFRLLESAGAFK
jgi:crotonobetainyl-CoA:carnitine CoA-transferase CaiB-like acyl-CoA transferase